VHAASNAELVIVEKIQDLTSVEGSEIYQNFTFTVREVSDVYAARVRTEATDLEDSKKSINIPANNIYMTLKMEVTLRKNHLKCWSNQKVYVSVKVQVPILGLRRQNICIGINASDTAFH